MAENTEDDFLFADDTAENGTGNGVEVAKWKVLVVDDEPEIHSVTKLMLNKFTFDNKSIEITHAYSGAEAKKLIETQTDVAVILLDVVMESDDSGLQVVNYIRNILGNSNVRIILRTGQPGSAPEETVVKDYDIDGYRAKTEMTVANMNTTMVSSLRAYKEIQRIEGIVDERTKDLRDKNTEMMDSLEYAKRIQFALLPDLTLLRQYFKNSFIMYQPKAVISGDLYWYVVENGIFYIAAIDCTGHGVPGAMMSVLANSLLNEIIIQQQNTAPDKILAQLHKQVSQNLAQNTTSAQVADGMDLSLCCINLKTNVLLFSGAKRPLLLFRNKEAIEYEGDKASIGHSKMTGEERNYSVTTLPLQAGDTLYLFSDGVTDQFGGETTSRKRKLTKKKFIDFLQTIQDVPVPKHEELIRSFIKGWQGKLNQTDDMVVIGIQIQ